MIITRVIHRALSISSRTSWSWFGWRGTGDGVQALSYLSKLTDVDLSDVRLSLACWFFQQRILPFYCLLLYIRLRQLRSQRKRASGKQNFGTKQKWWETWPISRFANKHNSERSPSFLATVLLIGFNLLKGTLQWRSIWLITIEDFKRPPLEWVASFNDKKNLQASIVCVGV